LTTGNVSPELETLDRHLENMWMEASVRKFFERYTNCFNQSLGGEMDMDRECHHVESVCR